MLRVPPNWLLYFHRLQEAGWKHNCEYKEDGRCELGGIDARDPEPLSASLQKASKCAGWRPLLRWLLTAPMRSHGVSSKRSPACGEISTSSSSSITRAYRLRW
eukprot:scaffold35257_cov28-Tisochrysis_lutea.AAC.1